MSCGIDGREHSGFDGIAYHHGGGGKDIRPERKLCLHLIPPVFKIGGELLVAKPQRYH
jgi:hypothetical protein